MPVSKHRIIHSRGASADSGAIGVIQAAIRPLETGWLSKVQAWSGKGILALMDQGPIPGSNFLIAILLARELAPKEYGAFALAFEAFLFLAVVNGALILEPFSVFGSSVYRNQLRGYLAQLLRMHGLMAVAVATTAACGAWVICGMAPASELPAALAGVAVAAPCLLTFWLARRAFYVQLTPWQAVRGAAVYCAVLVLGLAAVHHYFGHLSPFAAFLLMAAGAAATTPMMLKKIMDDFSPKFLAPSFTEAMGRHWRYGRWALASAVMVWLSSAILYPLLASFHGLAEAG